jgi:hypothetical protein
MNKTKSDSQKTLKIAKLSFIHLEKDMYHIHDKQHHLDPIY